MKKISVITACYNSYEFIDDNVSSVENSITGDKFEIEHILIEDSSSDNTKEKIINYSQKHIKKIFHETNLGITASLNDGIDQSSGDYIFVLDHDDLITQTGLKYLFKDLEKNEKQYAYSNALHLGPNLEYLIGKDYWGSEFQNANALLVSILTKKHTFLPTYMFSKKLFKTVGGFENGRNWGLITDLFIKFILAGQMPLYVPIISTLRRIHGGNYSMKHILNPQNRADDLKELYRKYKIELGNLLTSTEKTKIESFLAKLPKESK